MVITGYLWLRKICTRQLSLLSGGDGSSNDGYTIRTDDILASVPGKPEENDYEKIVDDVIQWSEDIETAFHRLCAMLSHCSKAGMVFSPPLQVCVCCH